MINRIVFAAGGTGGHIFPAVAVADELKKLNKNIDIYFIGAKGKIEESIVPECGYKLKTINITGFQREISLKNIILVFKLISALKQSRSFLKKFNPDVVFGTGGYVSGPVLWNAAKLNIPSVLHEGNYYPGVTVKLLASKIDKLILNFDESKKFFKRKDNITVMAYPVRQNLKRYTRDEANKFFGLSSSKKTLFVFGGSQGANSINKALLNAYKNLIDNQIQIIWQIGYKDYASISSIVTEDDVKLFKFIDKIDYAYSASDLVLCRSGISSVMEIAKYGIPAVFVPLPSASENHQEKNARMLVEKNAAEIILDKDLNKELNKKILSLLNDSPKLQQLSINIQKFAHKDAALKIAEFLMKISDEMKN